MTTETYIIPELETIARHWSDPREWTDKQLWQLERYYGRVPMSRLREYVNHSIANCHKKAKEMGITLPRPPLEDGE